MGVKMLNKYLKEYSKGGIKEIPLSNMRHKRIAIDTSIFLYQFKGDDALLENMLRMLETFRRNHIVPVYIFDGTPPEEKNEALSARDETKKVAKEKCTKLEEQINSAESEEEKCRLEKMLKNEKKKCIRITNADIRNVKELIKVMGGNYMEAVGEADELCAYLVAKNHVWACMSEDMDMFVYGCQRVLRNFSLDKSTCTLYSMRDILNDLNMTHYEFKSVCMLSGTDYNHSRFTIFTTMGLFYKYLRKRRANQSFYDWLIHIKSIDHNDKSNLVNSAKLFSIGNYTLSNVQFMNSRIMKEEVEEFIKKHDLNNLSSVYT
jgi:flap endonuclease-1